MISAQNLQCLLLQGELPVLGGGAGVVILAETSKSLRFHGHLERTRDRVGRASWSLRDVGKVSPYYPR